MKKNIKQDQDYKFGFRDDINQDIFKKGLTEETIRQISTKNNEPVWLLEFRLKAFEKWNMERQNPPQWADLDIQNINFDEISFYAGIKKQNLDTLEMIKATWIKELNIKK